MVLLQYGEVNWKKLSTKNGIDHSFKMRGCNLQLINAYKNVWFFKMKDTNYETHCNLYVQYVSEILQLSFGAVFYSFPSKHHFKKLMTSFRQVHMGPLFVKDIYEYPLINCIHQTLLTVLRNIYETICSLYI